MEKRYKKTDYDYARHYLVECPKCKDEATVSCEENRWRRDHIQIKCRSCMFNARLSDSIFYKATVKRNCSSCGKEIFEEIDNLKEAPTEMSVTCPNCQFKAEYAVNVSEYCYKNTSKLKQDPYFGYSLWLQTDMKGNLFWAYNREHLEEIRTYVDAALRERQSSYLMTMVARLPRFITDAKNRELVLKKIKELQYKTK